MAKVSGALTTYQKVGTREDLWDKITDISPSETPVLNLLGRRNVTAEQWSWLTDKLPAPDRNNARVDGFELERRLITQPARVFNTTQISSQDATVSGSAGATTAAGRASEMGRAMTRASRSLKTDMEAIALSLQARNDGEDDGAPTARRTRSILHFITTNVRLGVGGAVPTSPTAAATAGTPRDFTRDMLRQSMTAAFKSGARPRYLVCGPENRVKVSGFTAVNPQVRQEVDADELKLGGVTVVATDFGGLTVVPALNIEERNAVLLDNQYARIAFQRAPVQSEMAKIGDAETRMIVTEWGIQVDNADAHARISDLTEV